MSSYTQLSRLADEAALIDSTASSLAWDQETYMPPKALAHRANQLGYLSGKGHALITSKRFRSLLEKAEAESSEASAAAKANLREWRRQVDRSTKLPRKLVERFSQAASLAKPAWAAARKASDFKAFAPHLEKLLGLTHQKAELWGYATEPYDALLDEYETGANTVEIASLFEALKPQLSGLAREAVERSASVPEDLLQGEYSVATQQALNREVAESIGFDFHAGRIDTTTHPFCTRLGPGDVRLTTRYSERDFTSSLMGVLHEAGHGLYEQGLPVEDYGLPSGTTVSLGIHESQSRLWENHVGRSRAFWERWLPRAQALFHSLHITLDEFLSALHRAKFSFIRVEADEATYDLHIALRFSIERRLLNHELKIKDLPQAWNAEFHTLFGLTPPDDARGCLQDIHWSMGALGYFPTYTLGNLNAAQLFHTALSADDIRKAAGLADYAPLLAWLRQRVHARGSVLLPRDLMIEATGEPTNSRYHLEHLRRRYLGSGVS